MTSSTPSSSVVVSLRLDKNMLASAKEQAKKAGLSINAYVKRLLSHADQLISEEELLEYCKESKNEQKAGKLYTLHDTKDLLNDL